MSKKRAKIENRIVIQMTGKKVDFDFQCSSEMVIIGMLVAALAFVKRKVLEKVKEHK